MSVITYVNAGAITETVNVLTVTPALPANIAVGNLLIAVVGGYRTGVTTYAWSAGWTVLGSTSGGNYSGISIAYRIATGADPLPTITTTVGIYAGVQIFQYASVVGIGAFASAAADNPTDITPGFTTQNARSTTLYLTGSYSASGDTVPTGFTRDLRTVSGSIQVAAGRNLTDNGDIGSVVPSITFSRGTYGGTFQLELIPVTASIQSLPLITASGYAYSAIASSGTVPYIIASGIGELSPNIPRITASGTAITASIGTSAATIPLIAATGTATIWHTGNFAQSLQLFALGMTGEQQAPLVMQKFQMSMTGYAGVVASLNVQTEQFISAMESYPSGSANIVPGLFSLAMYGVSGGIGNQAGVTQYFTVAATGYVSSTAVNEVTLRNFLVSMSAGTSTGATFNTVAMHTEWQGLTQYTNYPFNSFAIFNNQPMGASNTGLYVLSGNTDNGTNIDAVVRVGVSDLGTSHLKRINYVYVGYRTTGDLLFRMITDDAKTRDYRAPATGETGIHVKRIQLGKGVIARYYQFEIQNVNGADFDLNTLEIKPTVLSRRIQGGRA